MKDEGFIKSGANTALVGVIFFFDVAAIIYMIMELFLEGRGYFKDEWNLIDIAVNFFTSAYVIMYAFDIYDEDKDKSYLLGLAVFFLGIKLISFYRLHKKTRYFIRMILEIMAGTRYFVLILISLLLSIAFALMAIRENDNFGEMCERAYRWAFGDWEDPYDNHKDRIFFFMTSFLSCLVLLNLIIAIMSDVYATITANHKIADINQ